jgi:AcrR family transcriptional regulator
MIHAGGGRYEGGSMQSAREDRLPSRRDMVAAGRSVVGEIGLAALQMDEVARRAGVEPDTLEDYFPDKKSLYVAMYAERVDEMFDEVGHALTEPWDIESLFISFANVFRNAYAEFGKDVDILAAVGDGQDFHPTLDPELTAAGGRIWDIARDVLARTPAKDPELLLAMLWSTMTGLADHFTGVRHEMHRHTWDETVRYTARTMARGLAAEWETQWPR